MGRKYDSKTARTIPFTNQQLKIFNQAVSQNYRFELYYK